MNNFEQQRPSTLSLFGLSWLVFLISDVQGGIGPFISIYLKTLLNWNTNQIGIVLAVYSIASLLSQIPSGMIIDASHSKRLLIGIATGAIAMSSFVIATASTLWLVVCAQTIIGIATSIIPPAIAAITLGLVGREPFPKRLTVNGTFNHAGNVVTAIATGTMAQWLGLSWILYVVTLFSIASLLPLLLIRPQEINNDIAREAPSEHSEQVVSVKKLLTTPAIVLFAISVCIFTFSNAAQLPLLGEKVASISPSYGAVFMASSIFLAQTVMILVAYSLGMIIDKIGRKPLFLLSFLILTIRALLYPLSTHIAFLLAIQILDGIAAGIFAILSVVITSDLAKDSGRFNFMQGVIILCISLGAALSNLIGGYIANLLSIDASFIFLGTIAAAGFIFYLLFMPETKDRRFIT